MTPREEILAQVRQSRLPSTPLPDHQGAWLDPPDRVGHFGEVLQSVGGNLVRVGTERDVAAAIEQDERYRTAACVYSRYPAIASRGLSPSADEVLRGERQLDLSIAVSSLAVAENAAVYLAPQDRTEHALLFLCEHLVLVVSADSLVANMHQAYDRLVELGVPIAGPPRGGAFGIFISGPSKTADIEQALVMGAQGPRSLTIMLLDRYNTESG